MKEEINSIEKNQTWELVDPPPNKKLIALKSSQELKGVPRGLFHNEATGIPKDHIKMKAFPFSLDGATKD
ncbi:hypothetical protein CR513_32094, partial [Mucuna pruriens]